MASVIASAARLSAACAFTAAGGADSASESSLEDPTAVELVGCPLEGPRLALSPEISSVFFLLRVIAVTATATAGLAGAVTVSCKCLDGSCKQQVVSGTRQQTPAVETCAKHQALCVFLLEAACLQHSLLSRPRALARSSCSCSMVSKSSCSATQDKA
jgi:hypothetical protein